MMDRDYEAKMQAQKQQQLYADQANANTCSTPQAQCGGPIGKAVGVSDGAPLDWQLRERMHALETKHARTARALDILTRHPEFAEFLELQQLINQGVQY